MNLRFSWLQTANSGLFIVYNEVNEFSSHGRDPGKEFTIKYSRIFDILN